jgi:AraC-like DNA-binding protein
MNTIFTIGIFLSFFLSLLLAAKKQKYLPDIILAIWLSIIGIHLTSYYLYSLDYWTKYPHLVGVTLPVPLLHGPMLFLYTLYSLRDEKSLRKVDYLHFAPALLAWLYMCRFYFFYSAQEKIMVDKGLVDDFAVFSVIALVAFIISGLVYPVLAYRWIEKYNRLINDNFSYDNRISLTWLKYCIYGTGLLYLTVAVVYFFKDGIGIEFPFNADFIFYIMIVIFVISIGFFGIRHQNIFTEDSSEKKVQLVQSKLDGEYKKSGLKPEVAEDVHQKLLDLMEAEKSYTNPKLTLSDLATSLNVSANHLSQIINQNEKMNFHDFVNKYRVEEFIQNASTNRNFSILAHALDAGFNSKSSFNNVFKKHKGITPSKYMNSLPS